MAQKNKIQAAVLVAILVLPLVFYFVFKAISYPVFDSVPFQYRVNEAGDSLVYTLEELPAYYLNGESVEFEDFKDKILLIDFFSLEDTLRTTVLHGNLQRVYNNIRDTEYIRMLSIYTGDTIRPELVQYGEEFASYGDSWQILWMDSAAVRRVGVKNLGIQEFAKWYTLKKEEKTFPEFTSQTIALLDKEGKVRQYFEATDLGVIKRINEDLRALTVLEYPEELRHNQ